MRICFTSDLHGDAGLYDQLEDLLRIETPDLLILGGDLLVDGDPADPLGTQVAYLQSDFMARVARWKAGLPGLTVACIPGNHEWICSQDAWQKHHAAGRLVLLDHRRLWHRDGLAFLGYSGTPATPHWLKDFERLDLPDDPLPQCAGVVWDPVQKTGRSVSPAEHYDRHRAIRQELAEAPSAPDPWFLVCHVPPYGTQLDRLPDTPQPIGSRAIRDFIQERQPRCALHGHIHYSPGVTGSVIDRVGRTVCINPGQDHHRLHAVIFDADRPEQTLRHTVYRLR